MSPDQVPHVTAVAQVGSQSCSDLLNDSCFLSAGVPRGSLRGLNLQQLLMDSRPAVQEMPLGVLFIVDWRELVVVAKMVVTKIAMAKATRAVFAANRFPRACGEHSA